MNDTVRILQCPKCNAEVEHVSGSTPYGSVECDRCETHMNVWGQEILPPSDWLGDSDE